MTTETYKVVVTTIRGCDGGVITEEWFNSNDVLSRSNGPAYTQVNPRTGEVLVERFYKDGNFMSEINNVLSAEPRRRTASTQRRAKRTAFSLALR